jgi:polar amino acid transport system substrate-binding protein
MYRFLRSDRRASPRGGWLSALLLAIVLGLGLLPVCQEARAQDNAAGDRAIAAAARILDHARQEAVAGCENPSDVLVRVLCQRHLLVGLRTYYPGFSIQDEHGEFKGFEPDIAHRVAAFLGVELIGHSVDPKSRIPMLADGHVDLVIATMGHSVQRAAEVRFIRPHYYFSRTAVVGPRTSAVADWEDLVGRTVCLPLGSNSNLDFVRHHVRILTFERPEQLLDALRFNQCGYIVQDDTFFAGFLADPAWAAQYDIKFRFAPLPWGMAVAKDSTDAFASLLEDLSVAYHANGVFLQLAKANEIDISLLETENAKWTGDACVTSRGAAEPGCLTPPVDNADTDDLAWIAPYVDWIERTAANRLGVTVDLSVFQHRSTIGLLEEGVSYSLALIVGTQISTLAFALGFGWLMVSGPGLIRYGIGFLTAVGQVMPLPLLMFFVYVVAGGIAHYSGVVALIAAIFAIGLYNGSNAARAIHEAHVTLLKRDAVTAPVADSRASGLFMRTIVLASVQLVAFLINAAKGSPAAGMIGVPEFLNVVTDLTANSRDRITMHLTLLIFYVTLVLIVIRVLTTVRTRLVAGSGRW